LFQTRLKTTLKSRTTGISKNTGLFLVMTSTQSSIILSKSWWEGIPLVRFIFKHFFIQIYSHKCKNAIKIIAWKEDMLFNSLHNLNSQKVNFLYRIYPSERRKPKLLFFSRVHTNWLGQLKMTNLLDIFQKSIHVNVHRLHVIK
jgi:hypothetical protein